MEAFFVAVQSFVSGLGSSVLIPLLLVLFGLLLGVAPARAIRGGLTAGLSLVSILMMGGALRTTLAQLAVEIGGVPELGMPITDLGGEPISLITYGSSIGTYIIPLYLLMNLLLLLVRATRTINIDLWNFWHLAFIGAMVEILTGSFWLGILATLSGIILSLCLADLAAEPLQQHLEIPNLSVAHGFAVAFVPIAWLFNALFDLIPAWKRSPVTLEALQKRLGFAADPLVLGAIVGGGLSALAGRDAYTVLQDAATMGAVVFLLPRIAGLFAQGFAPIGEGLQRFAQKRLGITGSLYLGLTPTLASSSATVLLTTMALVPPLMWTAEAASFAQFMPAASLNVLLFVMVLVVAVCRGDILRSLVAGYASMVAMLYCGTALAPLFTQAAITRNPDLYSAAGLITSIHGASSPLSWVIIMVATFGLGGLLALLVLSIGAAMVNHNHITGKGSRLLFSFAWKKPAGRPKSGANRLGGGHGDKPSLSEAPKSAPKAGQIPASGPVSGLPPTAASRASQTQSSRPAEQPPQPEVGQPARTSAPEAPARPQRTQPPVAPNPAPTPKDNPIREPAAKQPAPPPKAPRSKKPGTANPGPDLTPGEEAPAPKSRKKPQGATQDPAPENLDPAPKPPKKNTRSRGTGKKPQAPRPAVSDEEMDPEEFSKLLASLDGTQLELELPQGASQESDS